MWGMDAWDIALLVAAGYVAVVTLVRLMRARRDTVIDELVAEAEEEQERKKQKERRERRRQLREQLETQQQQQRDAA